MSRLSMCGVTLCALPWTEQLRLAAENGCAGMGVFHSFLPHDLPSDELRRALDSHELQATICVPKPFNLLPSFGFSGVTGRSTQNGSGLPASLDAMIRSLEWLAPLKPDCVLVIPGAQGRMSYAEAWGNACAALSHLCEVADHLGIKLCIEPVHPRFAKDFSIVATIDDALQMISDVGAGNLGVLIEVFHIWDVHDRFDQIDRAAGKIFGVQLSDSASFPRSIVDRLPPGDGQADIAAIVRAIQTTGYKGWYDIEVVCDDGRLGLATYPDSPWLLPVEEFARRCVEGSATALYKAMI